jgi:hypothetical protein
MQTFTLGLRRSWWIRVLGRNPLVRTSDRVEALVLALAVFRHCGGNRRGTRVCDPMAARSPAACPVGTCPKTPR